jgi:predicted nucleotidyltransferase
MENKISKKVEKEIKKIIFQFLNPLEYKVFIFGSRATNKAKKFSDYDIGIIGKRAVPGHILVMIEEVLEESDLPFKVEVVDFSLVSSTFRQLALLKTKELRK